MRSRIRYSSVGAIALALTAVVALAGTPTRQEARQAGRRLEKSKKSLDDIIQMAEHRTGGTAISVALVDQTGNATCAQSATQRTSAMNSDNGKSNDTSSDKQATHVAKTSSSDALAYRVTCLVDNAKLKDVFVCANTCKIENVRDAGEYNAASRSVRKVARNAKPATIGTASKSENPMLAQRERDYEENGIRTVYDPDPANHHPASVQDGNRFSYEYESQGDQDAMQNNNPDDDAEIIIGFEGQPAPDQMVLGSKLLNAKATNSQDQKLGRVDEVVIDPDDGQVVYTAVDYGGVFGIGEKHFAVPTDDLDRVADGEAYLDIDKIQLKDDPGFERGQWPRTADARLDAYPLLSEVVIPAKTERLSKLIGEQLRTTNGEKLGEVKDAVVDTSLGQVAYLIVDSADKPGRVAVPVAAVQMKKDQCVLTNMSKARFDHLETFERNNYPTWTDASWNDRIRSEFDV